MEQGGADKERQYKNAMETWIRMMYRSGSQYMYVSDNLGGGGEERGKKNQE